MTSSMKQAIHARALQGSCHSCRPAWLGRNQQNWQSLSPSHAPSLLHAASNRPLSLAARRLRIPPCHSNQPDSPQPTSILDNERVIATLTSVGISGSLAILGANIANLLGGNVNLWNQFGWIQGPDLEITLQIGAFLLLYEFLLLGIPWYQGLRDGGQTTGQTDTAGRAAPSPPAGDSELAAAAGTTPDQTDISSSFPRSPFNLQLIGLGLQGAAQEDQLSAGLVRATLALQQACFVAAATVRADIPPAVDVGLIVLRESSKELLQRGLAVTFLSVWLADRFFEAGADNVLAVGSLNIPTIEACRWAVATWATVFLLPPVLADAQALSLSVATNQAVMQTQSGDEPSLDKLIQEYRLYEALQRTARAWPARLTQTLHTFRGVLRFASVNAVFAITQNLTTSLLLSTLSNLLLLAYAVQGRAALGLRTRPFDEKDAKGKRPPTLQWPPDDKDDE